MFLRTGPRSVVHSDGYEVREFLPRDVEYRHI